MYNFSDLKAKVMLLIVLVVHEWQRQLGGTVLRYYWLVIRPLIMMGLYSATYILIFKIRPMGMEQSEYILYIFSGLLPFLGFAEGLSAGTNSLKQDKDLLFDELFPAELLPVRSVLAAQGAMGIGLVILIFVSVALGKVSWSLLLLPIVWTLMILFLIGLCWVFSLINIVLGDLQMAINLIVLALMIISPIAYTEEMVPSPLRPLIYLNPLAYFIRTFQDIYLDNIRIGNIMFLGSFFWALLFNLLGYLLFRKMRHKIFDYL